MSGDGAMEGVSGVVIAQDAADSVARCIHGLSFADEVVVVDGGSADETVAVARSLGARVVVNPWPGFAAQRRFALAQAGHAWVFACDADEEVTPVLGEAIRAAVASTADPAAPDGYRVRRRNQFLGAWIDAGPWAHDFQVRLVRRDAVQVTEASVHEGYRVDGEVATLEPPLNHYTHPTLSDCVRRMNSYTTLEAEDRRTRRRVHALDPLVLPVGVFLNYYLVKGCWRAGVRGFLLAATTAMYRSILYVKLRLLQANGSRRALS